MEEELRKALQACVDAMKKSVHDGSTDHLDCHDDGGQFWYEAVKNAEALLNVQ